MSVVQRVAKDLLIKKEPKKSGAPSVFGPGFSHVPGGDDFLNRTAMSWHYYCWALGQVVSTLRRCMQTSLTTTFFISQLETKRMILFYVKFVIKFWVH